MNHPRFPRVSRRSALAGLAALPVALRSSFTTPVVGAESNNFIIRERVPENLESDFSALDSFIKEASANPPRPSPEEFRKSRRFKALFIVS